MNSYRLATLPKRDISDAKPTTIEIEQPSEQGLLEADERSTAMTGEDSNTSPISIATLVGPPTASIPIVFHPPAVEDEPDSRFVR